MNKKHKFKYLKVEEDNDLEAYKIVKIGQTIGTEDKDNELLAHFYDLDLALQTAYFLDELYEYQKIH